MGLVGVAGLGRDSAAGRVEVLPLRVAEVGLGRAQVRPVGLRLESVRCDRDELVIDGLPRGLAQQVLDHPLAFVVVAFAEVVVSDSALRICEVDGRPAKALQTP